MKYIILVACVVGTGMARPDGAGGHGHGHHDHGHSAPQAAAAVAPSGGGYQEPSSGYADPGSGYDAPSGYAAAAAATGYETSGYAGAAASGYGQTGYAVQEESAFNPSMLIIPILIIAGIALLFPSVTTVPVDPTTGRRKRDAEDEVSGNSLVGRVQDIYMAVISSEQCMERVACEMGGIVADAGISKDIFSAAAPFVPSKYSSMMKQFNNAKSCHKIKCGSMF